MKPIRLAAGGTLAAALAACVPTPPRPAPPAEVRPTPTPTLAAPPPPLHENWVDAPLTVGDWSYRAGPTGGTAIFGDPQSGARFSLRCDRNARVVTLWRAGQGAGAATMTLRSESQTRNLPAAPTAGQVLGLEARLPASDRLLDAIAFSKGRFAVETPGAPALHLPSWTEVTRVIEDCR